MWLLLTVGTVVACVAVVVCRMAVVACVAVVDGWMDVVACVAVVDVGWTSLLVCCC